MAIGILSGISRLLAIIALLPSLGPLLENQLDFYTGVLGVVVGV
jgi:hypothetical protein